MDKLSQYTDTELLQRYENLMLEFIRPENMYKRTIIDDAMQPYIDELWKRNGGWNG